MVHLIKNPHPVTAVAINAEGTAAISGDEAGIVVIWDLKDPTNPWPVTTAAIHGGSDVTKAAMSADGRTAITTSSDTVIVAWDLSDTHRPVPTILPHPLNSTIDKFVMAPDGKSAVICLLYTSPSPRDS